MADVFEKLREVEFGRLPAPVRKAFLAAPIISAIVEPSGNGFRLVVPNVLDKPAPQAMLPKLGIKSWRDAGRLGIVYEGVNMLAMLEPLLKHPTHPQRVTARSWTDAGEPLHLHLFSYVDFSGVSVARFLADKQHCQRISVCLRGESGQSMMAAMSKIAAFAQDIAAHLPDRRHILEVAYRENGDIGLVEVNPGLTPRDLAVLGA
jgi:hypothetical protein